MADTPIAAPEEQDKGPQQLDKPPYPGTSKIENGQAFDVAGKVLGSVDDSGQAVKQTAPAQPASTFDFGFTPQAVAPHQALAESAAQPVQAATQPSGYDFGFKPAGAGAGAAAGTKWESYAKMGNYFYAHPMEGEENKGMAHSVHTFLSFPNALYHAFQDPATEQEKAEIAQKMNQMRAGQGSAASALPAVPGEYVGAITNTYDKKAPSPTRTQLALHRLVDAPADQLDEKANKELETARELWNGRESWGASVPVGMGISIPLGPAIALSQSTSGAADKVLSKIPMLGPLVNSIAEKFENGDVSGGLTDLALLKAAEHVHGKITGEEPTTPSRIFTDKGHELGKGARAALDSFKEATVGKLKPAVSDAANAAKEDFKSAAPPSKAAPYDDNDYEIVRRTAEQGHKADKLQGGEGISGIETARDIVEDGRHTIEAKRSGAVQRFADKPITTNVFEDVANALAEKDKTTPGFQDEGMKVLDEHNFKDLTNKEADAIRKTLVAKNRLMEKNPWDAASLRESNPEYAARETVIDSLRRGIYGSLQEAGVPEAYDWARDEAAHIRVRKALDRQIFNAEKTVRGSADVGPLRKITAATAKAGSTAIGTGIGAAVGGVPGAIIGGAAGTVAGEGISRAILPSDMTRNELMARSFGGERQLATPEGPTVPPSQATEVPYPQGPAGPDLPPPPQPIPPTMPPPDHALHAALATRIGTTVERSNLDNLMSKFQEYLDNTPTNKLTDADRDLLQQLNESQADRKSKVTEAVQKAYDQNKAARDKWQAEVKKIQEKHAVTQETEKQKAIDDAEKGETPTDENPHLASLGRGDESGLVSHSFAMKAHSPILPIEDLPEGLTPEAALRHEFVHIALDAIDGEPTGHEIRSDSHPKAVPGEGASSVFDASAIKDPEGNTDPEALRGQLTKWLTQKMGGPASHEVFDGLTKDEAMNNPATRADVRQARSFVRDAHPEFSPSQVEEVVDAAYERARDFISQPHIAERIKANAAVREDGLPATHHASRGRVTQFQKDILEAHNEHEGTTDTEPTGGGTGEGGKKAAKPEPNGKKNAGGEKAGSEGQPRKSAGKSPTASGVTESSQVSKTEELRVPFKEGRTVPPERTTGEHDAAIKEGGAIPGGIQQGDEEIGLKDLALFHDPTTGSTLALPTDKITPENVKTQLQKSRAMYLKAKPEESRVPTKGQPGYDETIHGAEESGITNPVYHGTTKDFETFNTNEGMGSHFGTRAQAEHFAQQSGGKVTAHKLNIQNPLELPDLGDWNPESVTGQLVKSGVLTEEERSNILASSKFPNLVEGQGKVLNADIYNKIRTAIEKKEYDGIKYHNAFEGSGHGNSYIAFKPEQISPFKENQGAAEPQTISDKLIEKHGESNDPLSNGFILSDGRRVDMGATDHADAVRTVTPMEERSPNNQKDMVDYLNNEGVVRTRYRDTKGGKEVVFSVPKGGVTEDQITQMRQAVGKMGRNGNAVMEVAEGEGKSTQKEFVRPSDIEPMLREIGAHSDQATKEPNDWVNKAEATKGEGFSFHPGTGEAPTDGYMVETHLDRGQQYDHPPTAEDIRAFTEKNKDLLSKNPDLYVGGYKNSLGISERLTDQAAAEDLGKKTNQISIYDVKGGKEIPTGGTGEVSQPVETSAITKKSPKGSTVPLMDNPLPVKGTMKGDEVGTLDVTKALNAFSRKSNPALEPGSEPKEMVARAKKIAEDEAKYQLAQSKTGTEWYTTEMKDHDKVLQGIRPELGEGETTDAVPDHPVSLTLFKAAEAILSSGQKPYRNVKSAVKAWDLYKETGQFPSTNPETGKSWGPRNVAAYGSAFDSVNKLIQEKGEKGAADWLLSEHPVKELRSYQAEGQTPVRGKATDTETGAMILGAKRGPFMQNLHGIESKFTADMWVSRTWNRWMGTLDLDPRIEDKGKMTSESDVPRNNTERGLMKESFEKTAGKLGLSTSSLQAVLWYYEQALYRAHGLPVESWSFSDAAKRVAGEHNAAESEQTGFNFGENAKKQGVMEGLEGKPQDTGRLSALDFINRLKKK